MGRWTAQWETDQRYCAILGEANGIEGKEKGVSYFLYFGFLKNLNLYSDIAWIRLPKWLSGKQTACQAGDVGLIPGPRRSAGEGSDNPLQYSCLGNTKDRGAWQATVHGVAKE